MGLTVRYENGAIMTYQLTAFSPKEGFNVVFTGTKGRMEVCTTEVAYINAGGDKEMEGAAKTRKKSNKGQGMIKFLPFVSRKTKKQAHIPQNLWDMSCCCSVGTSLCFFRVLRFF